MHSLRSDYVIEPLEASLAPAVETLTFPAYRHLLTLETAPRHPWEGDPYPIRPFGAVACAGGGVVGLVLGEQRVDAPSEVEVLSLYVEPEDRGRGIGTRLVQAFEEQAVAAGATRVHAVFMAGRPWQAAVERVLAKRGWQPPVARTVAVHFTPDEAASTPWLANARRPDGLEIFAWTELGAAERAALRNSHLAQPWVTEGLGFWRYEPKPIDTVSSVGGRYRGHVVGWVLNHRTSDDVVRFTCSFIREDLARRACILPLYRESIERLRAEGRTRLCTFVTPVSYQPMVAFIRKRCAPWAHFVGETRGSTKELLPR